MRNLLLVIDLQRQFKDADEINYRKCIHYIATKHKLYDETIGTVFSRTVDTKDNFVKLLHWDGCINCNRFDLDYQPDSLFLKSTYMPEPENYGILPDDHIDIMGCDADACVLAACFYFFDHGYNFRILSDHIYSSEGPEMTQYAKSILKRNFGDAYATEKV